MEEVGVRELRQQASHLLRRVKSGESLVITSHGQAVARLVPLDAIFPRSSAALIAAGLMQPGRGDPLEVEPVTLPAGSPSTDDVLAELRAQ